MKLSELTTTISVVVPLDLLSRIMKRVNGKGRSKWIRDACIQRIVAEDRQKRKASDNDN